MLCSRCKKRPAMVFIATDKNNLEPQGLCLMCARELGIEPVNDIMDKMGMSEEDLEAMREQLGTIFSSGDNDESAYEDIFPGGATTFPFLKNIFSDFSNNVDSKPTAGNSNVKDKDNISKKKKHLDLYCYNLTKKARNGELDAVIGRDKEIARVIQILSRRTKNNPCLIGEPGVGKTAIAEGLAIKISEGTVPLRLRSKEVYLLDLTALVAGTQFRGQFEGRIKGLLDEVKAAGNIILVIDEVHNIVGTGETESNSMNAANILKPSLSRGEIQVIGATTFSEYRKYIEKDSALERRFQPVTVVEPTVKETIDVLIGIKSYYENYHRVKISDNLIKLMTAQSERYITDRFLPDKAIDLLDEASAYASLRNKSLEQYDKMAQEVKKLKQQENELVHPEKETVDYEKLAKVRADLAKFDNEMKLIAGKALGTQVTEDDVAHVIELWTGIPASKVKETEMKKLSHIEERIKEKLIGQDEAVAAAASAIKRSRVQISPRRRPASFIFVGPTGVGKTELAKVLSKELFDSPETLIRLDMSEFMEKHSVSRIIGAPPGYVGYDESGQITEKIRRRPYSIILFDEIEKAHPDVLNILLQILDEGRITDAQGRLVNFENTVIIMTSNAGSDKKDGAVGFAKSQNDLTKEKAMKALSDFLRPEFLSRLDEIIVFRNLKLKDYEKIADLMLKEYVEVLREKSINLTYTSNLIKWIAKESINGKSGARDLRHTIRRNVEDKIACALIDNDGVTIKSINLHYDRGLEVSIL